MRPVTLGLVAIGAWLAGTDAQVLLVWSALAFVAGLVDMSTDISAQSHASRLAPPNQVERVYGTVASIQTVCGTLVAPAVAGVLVGVPLAMVVGVSCVVALLLLPLAGGGYRKSVPKQEASEMLLREAWIGLQLVWRDSWLRRSACMVGGLNIASAAGGVVSTVYLVQDRSFNPTLLGIVFAIVGASGAIGGLVAARFAGRLGFIRSAQIGGLAMMLNSLALLVSSNIVLIAVIWAVAALGVPLFEVSMISHRQKAYDQRVIGRINGTFQLLGIGIAPLGGVLGGLAATGFGVVPTLWGIVAVTAIAFMLFDAPR